MPIKVCLLNLLVAAYVWNYGMQGATLRVLQTINANQIRNGIQRISHDEKAFNMT